MAPNAVNSEQDITNPEYGIKADSKNQFDSGTCSWDSAEVVTIVQKVRFINMFLKVGIIFFLINL